MPDLVAQAVHDRPASGADVVDVPIQIEDEAERLRRRTDVVTRRGKNNDWRGDVANIEGRAIPRLQLVASQLVADEKIVHQELQLVAVQLDKVAPPLLEVKVALRPGVDVGIDLVLFAPQPICRTQTVEVHDQPGPVELPVAQVAGKPAAAEQPTGIAHRVFSVYALPVRHRRAGDQAGPE